jgi:hypothetical protein
MIDSLALVVADEQYHTRTTKDNTVKVSPKTSDAYRKLIHLREEQIVFHTYQPKEDRAYRVVLRGLHPTTHTDDIKTELNSKGHQVRM